MPDEIATVTRTQSFDSPTVVHRATAVISPNGVDLSRTHDLRRTSRVGWDRIYMINRISDIL
ncbi:MAG TPA: hypothetical protein EYG03_07295 [Planctomycetes bacterium]|nr:hypothetical protein [Planctomycetota bacterium]